MKENYRQSQGMYLNQNKSIHTKIYDNLNQHVQQI